MNKTVIGRRCLACPLGLRANRRQQAGQGAFRDIVQAGSAEAVRPRHALSALVLVSRLAKKPSRTRKTGRSPVRHRLLGHRAQPARNSHRPPAVQNLAEGSAALEKARSVGAKTERERDYLAARAMYADYDKVDHRTRLLAYAKAMEQLAARYPNDATKRRSIMRCVLPPPRGDKTYANAQGRGHSGRRSPARPEHPGVAHYLSTSTIIRRSPTKGSAARRYAKYLAPDAPHALHMPSHIHARRLLAGVRSTPTWPRKQRDFHEQLHAMDYGVRAPESGRTRRPATSL